MTKLFSIFSSKTIKTKHVQRVYNKLHKSSCGSDNFPNYRPSIAIFVAAQVSDRLYTFGAMRLLRLVEIFAIQIVPSLCDYKINRVNEKSFL